MRHAAGIKTDQRGFSMIEMLIVMAVIAILAGIVVTWWPQTKMAGNEGSAIASLRTIANAQYLFWTNRGQEAFAEDLSALGTEGMIDAVLASGVKSGYRFEMMAIDSNAFSITAVPANAAEGRRHFYMDQSAVIRFSIEGPAGPDSPPIPARVD